MLCEKPLTTTLDEARRLHYLLIDASASEALFSEIERGPWDRE